MLSLEKRKIRKKIKRNIDDVDKNIVDILEMIVFEASCPEILSKTVAFLKKALGFSSCSLYEMDSRNKIRPIYSDVCFEVLLNFRQKQIFKYKQKLMGSNDITPEDDENSVYHPIVLGKKLDYIFVFDNFSRPEKRDDYLEYMKVCKNLKIIMGCLHNALEIKRAKYTDGLTKLPNEMQLRNDIERCISRSEDYVLATIEIDNMDCYNNKFGVFFGDKIVKNVAVALVPIFSKNGNGLYRFFGARFAVLIKGTQEDSFPILQKIQECVNSLDFQETDIDLSCTIGAVEIQYLEKAVYDTAYQKVLEAARVEKGSICFSGERRQLEKAKTFSNENKSVNMENVATTEHVPKESDTKMDVAIETTEKVEDNVQYEYNDADVFWQEETYSAEEIEDNVLPEFCEEEEKEALAPQESENEVNPVNIALAEHIKKKNKNTEQTQEISAQYVYDMFSA